ncbi:MAG TPA: AAA family ATPase [Thermoanaerobaculia bacterium]|jgi:predicted AAA+ superfamily ATPase|nr:AAA family ATPase [Thermoanaerobaculia bacterium]
MVSIERALQITLPPRQSAFLWGPRKTGKSTYLRSAFPDSLTFDLLQTDLLLDLTRRPALLRERLLATPAEKLRTPVILDEVQKVPQLLDEVHWLIENQDLSFILCGSSARKLKRGGANLLGGRAWRYEMHPLTSIEIGDLDLLQALNRGLVPAHYLSPGYRRSLDAYVVDYLKEEVFDEGLTRNVAAFSRFFEAMGYSHGDLTSYANIARDCGVDAKTVKEYYQILVDTLLGTFVEPYKKHQERQVIGKAPKFYLFDVGVAGALSRRNIVEEKGEFFGRALEHFILMEIQAHRSYRDLGYGIHFWRTKSGLEVDFVLGDGEVAVEVKGTSRVDPSDFRSLRTFVEDHHPRHAILVCNERSPRLVEGIEVLPWREFLTRLWGGRILT